MLDHFHMYIKFQFTQNHKIIVWALNKVICVINCFIPTFREVLNPTLVDNLEHFNLVD